MLDITCVSVTRKAHRWYLHIEEANGLAFDLDLETLLFTNHPACKQEHPLGRALRKDGQGAKAEVKAAHIVAADDQRRLHDIAVDVTAALETIDKEDPRLFEPQGKGGLTDLGMEGL